MQTADVVIIGGGGIGTSILYYLLKAGCKKAILLEKNLIASESTGKSAGGFRQQFSTDINIKMSKLTSEIFETFNEEMDQETVFNRKGYIFLASTVNQHKFLIKNVELQKSLGVNVRLINNHELKELVPDINIEDIIGATYCPDDGYTDPYEIAQGYARNARRLGGKIIEKSAVIGITRSNGKISTVKTEKDEYSTPIIINAAGPWAAEIGKLAGLELPIKPYRRQIFSSGQFKYFADKKYLMPMVVDSSGVYMRSEGNTILMGLADKDEPPSFNQNVDWEFLEKMVVSALNRFPIFEELEIKDGWAGLYDTTPDHHAILGSVPELEGFILACGFSGHGFMHSAAVGKTISELILHGKALSIDINPLHISRFDNGAKGIEEISVI